MWSWGGARELGEGSKKKIQHGGREAVRSKAREKGDSLFAALVVDRAFPRAREDGCGGKYVELALLGKGFP